MVNTLFLHDKYPSSILGRFIYIYFPNIGIEPITPTYKIGALPIKLIWKK